MTLREHFIHNDKVITNEIKNQKVIKSKEVNIDSFGRSVFYNQEISIEKDEPSEINI